MATNSTYHRRCPCGASHIAKTYRLEQTDIQVSECWIGFLGGPRNNGEALIGGPLMMRKIADTQALRHELEKILTYASLPRPSREKIASVLRALSVRVAADDPDEYVSDLHEIATHDLEKIFSEDRRSAIRFGWHRHDAGADSRA